MEPGDEEQDRFNNLYHQEAMGLGLEDIAGKGKGFGKGQGKGKGKGKEKGFGKGQKQLALMDKEAEDEEEEEEEKGLQVQKLLRRLWKRLHCFCHI